jgi:hypothetical protein
MLRKLMELDKLARQKVESAQKEKDNLDEFLKTARRTLLKDETEKTKAAIREALDAGELEKKTKIAALASEYDATMKALEQRYADNGDDWIDTLFKACIE